MRRQPPADPPEPGFQHLPVDDVEPMGPHADELLSALEELGELGIRVDDATLTVRQGERLVLGEGDRLTELTHVDPVRGKALTVGEAEPTTDPALHWLMAETFPDDHAFLQVRLTPSVADRVAEHAREQGFSVADEIERGRDDVETRLNVMRALDSHDLVVTPRLGMLLRGPRTEDAIEHAETLLEDLHEGQDPRR